MNSRKGMETSKRIVLVTGIIFAVHILLSSALILLDKGDHAVALMSSAMPVYLAVAAGYFGKAGVENVTKIKNLSDSLLDRSVTNTTYYK